jgi:uncharacterized protein HemX
MPDGSSRMPRIRMPGIGRPGRGSRPTSEETTATKPVTEGKEAGKDGDDAQAAAKREPAAEAKPTAPANPTAGPKTPEPNLQERMEGLQGWMAEIERKQARITYFGGLALLLALGAAGAALYFGLTAHSDSATKSDLDALTTRVDSLTGAVKKNSKDTQNAINASIAQLQQSISGLQKQQSQAAANISTLQSQVAAGALNKKAAAGGATTTPGATPTTTTTPKKP